MIHCKLTFFARSSDPMYNLTLRRRRGIFRRRFTKRTWPRRGYRSSRTSRVGSRRVYSSRGPIRRYRRTCGGGTKRTMTRKTIGHHHKSKVRKGIHFFRYRIPIKLTGADNNPSWVPALTVNNGWKQSDDFQFYRIKWAKLVFEPNPYGARHKASTELPIKLRR